MSGDEAKMPVRERVWLTKKDHTVDPPRVVEERFIENGQLQSIRTFGDAGHLADRTFDPSPFNIKFEISTQHGGVDRPRYDRLLANGDDRSSVLILGAGPSKPLALPIIDAEDWEVWALNLCPPIDSRGRLRVDRWFDIHQRVAQSPDDLRWIAKCPAPIYVPDDLLDAGPNCVRYPIEDVERSLAGIGVGKGYWACTFAYQIALALRLGFSEIALFGVDLWEGTRRERTIEFANVAWWLGFAAARGVKITLPPGSRLGVHKHRYGLDYAAEIADVNEYLDAWPQRFTDERPYDPASAQQSIAPSTIDEALAAIRAQQATAETPSDRRIVGVSQTRCDFPDDDGLRACLATILRRTIDDVPDFRYGLATWSQEPSQDERAASAVLKQAWTEWLSGEGYLRFPLASNEVNFGDRGVVAIGFVLTAEQQALRPVVCRDGVVVWDPHPSGSAYATRPVSYEVLVAIDPGRSVPFGLA